MPGYQQSRGYGPPMGYRGSRGYHNNDDNIDPNSEQFRKLFIGGLSFDSTETGLKNYFSKWGEIVDCIVMREPQSKRSRGFGFITFKDRESVDDVQKNRDHKVDDRDVETKRAMPRDDTNIVNQQTVKKMFVGGLKEDTTKDQVREVFSEYGEIEEIELITDKATGKTKGFCFVTFDDYDPVDKLILMRRINLNNRSVELKKAFGKEGPPQGRGGMNMMMGMGHMGHMHMGGRGGRGDYNYGPSNFGNYGYNQGGGYGGGYGGQGSWQGGYNDYPPYPNHHHHHNQHQHHHHHHQQRYNNYGGGNYGNNYNRR